MIIKKKWIRVKLYRIYIYNVAAGIEVMPTVKSLENVYHCSMFQVPELKRELIRQDQ